MILKLFSFMRGYLIISVSGFSVERFINLAMNRDILLMDIKYNKSTVTMKVSIKGFKLLKPIAKKTKCRIKIVEKKGVPFFIFRYRKRKILFFGFIIMIIVLYLLSSRVWLITYTGLDRIEKNEFESYLKRQGLYVSCKKRGLDKEKIKENISKDFKEVAWVNIDFVGTKVDVFIKETIVVKEKDDYETPSNLVAKKDGVIDNIVVETGIAKVKPLDVVKKGDILITGEIDVKEDEFGVLKSYVPSNGDVLARTNYEFEFFVPYEYEEKAYTGKEKNDSRYIVFGKNIDFFNKDIKYESYNRSSVYKSLKLGENYPLPFVTIKDTYREVIPVKKTRSKKETEILANQIVDNKILREIAFDVNIVDKNIVLSENEEGILTKVLISATEDIGTWQDIEPHDENDPGENINKTQDE